MAAHYSVGERDEATGLWPVNDEIGTSYAQFAFNGSAQHYCDWRNNPTPQPKFKVGDRVRFVDNRKTGTPAMIITEYEIRYRVGPVNDHDNSTYAASALELAPPEPRAVVKHAYDARCWWVQVTMPNGKTKDSQNYNSEEQAEYIAAGLNANPDWSL